MIAYEEAYGIAKELKNDINRCAETTKAFIFGSAEDDNWDGGAGHTPVVILKEDGRAVSMPYYIGVIKPGKEIRHFDI